MTTDSRAERAAARGVQAGGGHGGGGARHAAWRRWCSAGLLALAGCGGGSDSDVRMPEPEVLSARDGTLAVELTAAPSTVTVAGRRFVSNVYNGQYIPPVLKLRRGDTLDLRLRNRIAADDGAIRAPQPSNMHFHGMTVSPLPPGDDVFLHLAPGADYRYRWQVPANHSMGAHWFHPHAHGHVEPQILSGMSGLLMIDGMLEAQYAAFAGLPQHHLLLKDIVLPGAPADAANTKTINGVIGGSLPMQPGAMAVWHLGNLGADAFFDLAVAGVSMWELARDGNLRTRPEPVSSIYLPPGSRSTVVVVAPSTPGRYAIRSQAVATGPQGDPNPDVGLGWVTVGGTSVDSSRLQARLRLPVDHPADLPLTPAQVRALPITRERTIVFSETPDGNTFFLNGRQYDPARDDVQVKLGDVERWTLRNVSGERHVFHIHQLDFLVTRINHRDPDETGLRDVIDLPWQANGVPGEVEIIIPFTDPVMVGRFVFHCHIVGHEDAGMMANIAVLGADGAPLAPTPMRTVPARGTAAASFVPSLQTEDVCRSPQP